MRDEIVPRRTMDTVLGPVGIIPECKAQAVCVNGRHCWEAGQCLRSGDVLVVPARAEDDLQVLRDTLFAIEIAAEHGPPGTAARIAREARLCFFDAPKIAAPALRELDRTEGEPS
jgi:hypothetical protein